MTKLMMCLLLMLSVQRKSSAQNFTSNSTYTAGGDGFTPTTPGAQNFTSNSTYTASGDDFTPTTPVDPCDEETQCPENSNCTFEGSKVNCVCFNGYVGENCEPGCEPIEKYVNNKEVKQDVNCTDNLYNAPNFTLAVSFSQTLLKDDAMANETCKETCDGAVKERPVGSVSCIERPEGGGMWSEPKWRDCSKTYEQQTTEEKLDNVLSDTDDPDEITAADVEQTIEVLNLVASADNVSADNAADFMQAVNNLAEATTEETKSKVSNSSDTLLKYIDDVAADLVLTNAEDGAYASSVLEETKIAISVVGEANSVRALNEYEFYYGNDKDWDNSYDLTNAGLSLTKQSKPDRSYIMAKSSAGRRVSFQMYALDSNLFLTYDGPAEQVSEGVVLGADGDGLSTFTMKFKVKDNITIAENNRFGESDGKAKQLQCMKWMATDSTWALPKTACSEYRAKDFYASCICTEAGEYIMSTTTVEVEKESGGGGLEAWEIVLIVLGVLAAFGVVAFIYKHFFSKKD